MNEFGKRLKMLRDQRELPLSKLAEDIGSTKSALSRYENGKMEPGLTVLAKTAEYFGVTLDWLAGNGSVETIQYSDAKLNSAIRANIYYEKIFDKCIKEDISPEKLSQMIDILKK